MPKEWARIEVLRKARREKTLKERVKKVEAQTVPPGIAAGRVVAEQVGQSEAVRGDDLQATAPVEGAEEQQTPGTQLMEGVGSKVDGGALKGVVEEREPVKRVGAEKKLMET